MAPEAGEFFSGFRFFAGSINNSEIYGKPIDKTGKCVKIMSVPCRTLRNCVRVARQSLNLFVAVRIRVPQPTKNALLSTKTKVRFLNDVCLRQMMTASPNDVRFANDVWLRHILWQTSHHCKTKWSNIIFAKQMHHIAVGDASLKYPEFYDIMSLKAAIT